MIRSWGASVLEPRPLRQNVVYFSSCATISAWAVLKARVVDRDVTSQLSSALFLMGCNIIHAIVKSLIEEKATGKSDSLS